MAASLSCAEESKAVKKDFELKTAAGEIAIGNVKVVMPADLSRPNAGLVLTDEGGNDIGFTVKPLAVIYDAVDGTMMSLKELSAGERVQVNYSTTPQGTRQATAVKVLPRAGAGEAKETEEALPEEGAIK
jgi:hypothetical protein